MTHKRVDMYRHHAVSEHLLTSLFIMEMLHIQSMLPYIYGNQCLGKPYEHAMPCTCAFSEQAKHATNTTCLSVFLVTVYYQVLLITEYIRRDVVLTTEDDLDISL